MKPNDTFWELIGLGLCVLLFGLGIGSCRRAAPPTQHNITLRLELPEKKGK